MQLSVALARRCRSIRWCAVVGFLGSLGAVPAGASNVGFLDDAPIAHFSATDLEIFTANLRQALDQAADGNVHRWSNPDSGSAGEIALVRSVERDGKRCRQARISNRTPGYSESKTDAVFCRQPDGRWKMRAPSRPKPARD